MRFILKDVEQHAGLSGPHANDIVAMVNKMLAIEWLSDVSQCLAETLEAGKNGLIIKITKLCSLSWWFYWKWTGFIRIHYITRDYITGELEEREDVGISLVEELLTDFLQLIHGTIRNLIPAEEAAADSDDENNRAAQNTVGYV